MIFLMSFQFNTKTESEPLKLEDLLRNLVDLSTAVNFLVTNSSISQNLEIVDPAAWEGFTSRLEQWFTTLDPAAWVLFYMFCST